MLGASGEYRQLGGVQKLRFKSQPETHIAGVNLVDTGIINDVHDYWVVGAESSTVYGPFSTQAEYLYTSVNRKHNGSANFDGWYIQAGYFLTDDTRSYKNGKLKNITPHANFGANGWGAWEVGLRFSSLNLNSHNIDGGHEQNFTVGLNWFVNPVVRISTNYVKVLSVEGGKHDGETPDLVQGRVQVAF
jgi:phosphate-selective porin OprO/OprP